METDVESPRTDVRESPVPSIDGPRYRSFDVYSSLLRRRVVFVTAALDEDAAGLVTAQLLHLEAEDATRDIYLYINTSGGSTATLLGVYDAMQCLRADVSTVCVGQAATAGAVLLAAGAPGKRFALAHSRIWIHQPQSEFFGGLGDLEIRAREVLRERRLVAEVLARHTFQPVEKVAGDADRDFIMSADEAREYGIIDHVIDGDHLPHVSGERD
jgi:ATP-dependent Clp protease, protease subunit